MKYWLFLLAKVFVVMLVVVGLEAGLVSLFPKAQKPLPWLGEKPTIAALLFMAGTFFIWTFGAGLLYLARWDQRRRCRTCLRKLIMPVESGSWANLVMRGYPRVATICPYGHGTLHEDELQTTGYIRGSWQPHDDNIWKELESYGPVGKGDSPDRGFGG